MSSCERRRRKPYNEDIRWRVVWQKFGLEHEMAAIARNLCITVSTVQRILHKFETSGSVAKMVYPAEKASRKISEPVQLFIIHLLLRRPGVYLCEIVSEVQANFQLEITESAVCKFIKKMNFTRQKLVNYAMQRDDSLRQQFRDDVALYRTNNLIFVDETGTKKTDAVRKFGYSLRGHPVKAQKLFVRGEHVTAIAAISMRGLEALKIVRGSVDGDVFYNFVCKDLLTKLQPFDGSNDNSVLVMDNCSIHHTSEVESALDDMGVITHFLPPYSPDYNPIELTFSKVKCAIKAMEAEILTLDIDTILLAAFATVTQSDCQAWIRSCRLY